MGWMSKLCETYENVRGTNAFEEADGQSPLIPAGFARKKAGLHVTITADAQFSSAYNFDQDTEVAIPSFPQAEARSGTMPTPYPLCEQLNYLAGDEGKRALYDLYMKQLNQWCQRPHAPACLKTLRDYLAKETLVADIQAHEPGLKFKPSAYAKKLVCFSVEDYEQAETRLWMREDVRESWRKRLDEISGERALCYVEGQVLPLAQKYPKLRGNAKLLSVKDGPRPFQFRGRFLDARQAVTISLSACARAHNTLDWLLKRQGFEHYGLCMVAWHTGGCPVPMPVRDQASSNDLAAQEDEERYPDTFEGYADALKRMAQGYSQRLTQYSARRVSQVVIMGMQAATTGRMSVNYYQEMPGNTYVKRLVKWYRDCAWQRLVRDKGKKWRTAIDTPTPQEIAQAVLGPQTARIALEDSRGDKEASKQVRGLKMRLLPCIVEGAPLPLDMMRSAFHRAAAPLGFTDEHGRWDPWAWRQAVYVACALIRCHQARSGRDQGTLTPRLDRRLAHRDYLYGRLLAVADWVENLAMDAHWERQTNAIRLMQAYAMRPFDLWPRLHQKLLPYLQMLGQDGEIYRDWLSEIECLFSEEDRRSLSPLGPEFLQGYYCQRQAMFGKTDLTPPRDNYRLSRRRSELYGCLLALADQLETAALGDEPHRTTNALGMFGACTQRPFEAWPRLHDKLIPYMQKLDQHCLRHRRYMALAERCFTLEDRWDQAPLNREALYGFYRMRRVLKCEESTVSLPEGLGDWRSPAPGRSQLYGQLLAWADLLEDRWLRLAQKDRHTNAVRYMPRFALDPKKTWPVLKMKTRPYTRRLRLKALPGLIRMKKTHERLRKAHLDEPGPLDSLYLHDYYCLRFFPKTAHMKGANRHDRASQ